MQTFLPYANFIKSAKCLDYKRLGKQRIEAKQILNALSLTYKGRGWKNHPAVKMWVGHERTLAIYGMYMCLEWIARGYTDNQLHWFIETRNKFPKTQPSPPWLGNRKFHTSHKSNLLRKNPSHYRKFWKTLPDSLPYVWPL